MTDEDLKKIMSSKEMEKLVYVSVVKMIDDQWMETFKNQVSFEMKHYVDEIKVALSKDEQITLLWRISGALEELRDKIVRPK